MLMLFLIACAEVVQTPACAQFVACVQANDEMRGTSTDLLRFEPGGDCWGTPAGSDLCDRACVNGLVFHRVQYPTGPDVCAP